MVGQDEPERLLRMPEATSEKGAEARQFLQRGQELGRQGTAAVAAASHSSPAAIHAVSPQARLQADQGQTVTRIVRLQRAG